MKILQCLNSNSISKFLTMTEFQVYLSELKQHNEREQSHPEVMCLMEHQFPRKIQHYKIPNHVQFTMYLLVESNQQVTFIWPKLAWFSEGPKHRTLLKTTGSTTLNRNSFWSENKTKTLATIKSYPRASCFGVSLIKRKQCSSGIATNFTWSVRKINWSF